MTEIRELRRVVGVKHTELAQAAGTSQPIAAYESGRKSPTLATVRRLARAVGLELTVAYAPPMTREERRSLHLHRALARRLEVDPDGVLTQARRTLKRMRRTAPSSQPLREWAVLPGRPVEALVEVLGSSGSGAAPPFRGSSGSHSSSTSFWSSRGRLWAT